MGCFLAIGLISCASVKRSWEHRGDMRYFGVVSATGTAIIILESESQKVRNCISNLEAHSLKSVDVEGEVKIQNGYMFISEYKAKNHGSLNEDEKGCLRIPYQLENRNVANGILYHPGILSKDVIYKFKVQILPIISGEVYPIEFPDRIKTFELK